jgi:uncharacterized RDD family membrane protein YckC
MSTTPNDAPELAGHGLRLAAALLDAIAYLVVIAAWGTVGFVAGLGGAAMSDSSDSGYDGWEELGWVLLGTFVGALVGVVCAVVLAVALARRGGRRNGQTIGKQLAGVRAVRAGGGEIGLGLALAREVAAKWLLIWIVAALASTVMGFADVGVVGLAVAVAVWYLPACFDGERRALHDRICATRVAVATPQPAAPAAPDDLWPATP